MTSASVARSSLSCCSNRFLRLMSCLRNVRGRACHERANQIKNGLLEQASQGRPEHQEPLAQVGASSRRITGRILQITEKCFACRTGVQHVSTLNTFQKFAEID